MINYVWDFLHSRTFSIFKFMDLIYLLHLSNNLKCISSSSFFLDKDVIFLGLHVPATKPPSKCAAVLLQLPWRLWRAPSELMRGSPGIDGLHLTWRALYHVPTA